MCGGDRGRAKVGAAADTRVLLLATQMHSSAQVSEQTQRRSVADLVPLLSLFNCHACKNEHAVCVHMRINKLCRLQAINSHPPCGALRLCSFTSARLVVAEGLKLATASRGLPLPKMAGLPTRSVLLTSAAQVDAQRMSWPAVAL